MQCSRATMPGLIALRPNESVNLTVAFGACRLRPAR